MADTKITYVINASKRFPSNHVTLSSNVIKTSTVSEMKIIVKCNFYRFFFSFPVSLNQKLPEVPKSWLPPQASRSPSKSPWQ